MTSISAASLAFKGLDNILYPSVDILIQLADLLQLLESVPVIVAHLLQSRFHILLFHPTTPAYIIQDVVHLGMVFPNIFCLVTYFCWH